MKFPSSALSILSTLCILGGAPALAMEPNPKGYSSEEHYVRVCITQKDVTPCYWVPYNDPDLIRFTQRHKPDVEALHIPLLSDAYESGLLFWGILLYLVGVSSVAVGWMILNWKKIRPTDPR